MQICLIPQLTTLVACEVTSFRMLQVNEDNARHFVSASVRHGEGREDLGWAWS